MIGEKLPLNPPDADAIAIVMFLSKIWRSNITLHIH
jgi:hypothetical protein